MPRIGSRQQTTVPSTVGFSAVPLRGKSTRFAREDHSHGMVGDSVISHVADADPHDQYINETRGDIRYAVSAKGVTNGDAHDHAGGDGGQIDHGGTGGLLDDDHTQYSLIDGTRDYTGKIAGPKAMITIEGGLAVKMTNKTGAASVKGDVVTVYSASAINSAVALIVVNIPNPFGVFYESDIADGNEAWVVVSGIADVGFIGNTSLGHIARGFLTADAGYITGKAMSESVPTSPFSDDKHFYEIGHVIEARNGAGIAKCILHFN